VASRSEPILSLDGSMLPMEIVGLVHRSCQLLAGLLGLQVLGVGCIEGECPEGGDPDPDGVEEAVWALALDRAFWNWDDYTEWEPIYVLPHTMEPEEYRWSYAHGGLTVLDPAVYEDFVDKNAVSIDVPADLDTEEPYVLLDEAPDQWPLHGKKKYSLVTVSRVGVDECPAQALVYWQMFCGWLCGNGDYVLVEWSDGTWAVTEEWQDWVS
jgi:hypothetical protein